MAKMKRFDKNTEEKISKQLLREESNVLKMRSSFKKRRRRRGAIRQDPRSISKQILTIMDLTNEVNNLLYQRSEDGGKTDKYNDTDLRYLLKSLTKMKTSVAYLSGLVGKSKNGSILVKMRDSLIKIEGHIKINIQEVRNRKKGKLVYMHDRNGEIVYYGLIQPIFDWEEDYNYFLVMLNAVRNRLSLTISDISGAFDNRRMMWYGSKRELADLLSLLWKNRFISPSETSERKFFEEYTKWFMDSDYRPMTDLRANYHDLKTNGTNKFSYMID